MSCVVALFDQAYVYGEVPPDTVKSIEPVELPLQSTFTWVLLKVRAEGWVMVAEITAVQAFASVTVTVKVPAARLEMSCVVALFDQAYV